MHRRLLISFLALVLALHAAPMGERAEYIGGTLADSPLRINGVMQTMDQT